MAKEQNAVAALDNEKIKTVQPELKGSLENDSDKEIDLLEVGMVLLDKIHFIIMYMLLGAVILNAFTYFFKHPTYTSVSKLYVVSASEDSVINLSDINIGSSLTADYEQLMLSYPVLDKVIDRLGLDMSSTQIAKLINITNPNNSRILNITVTCEDPVLAKDIANAMAEVSAEYLPETMSTHAPNIAQVAREATTQSGPSYLKFTFIGAFLGMFIYCAIVIVSYLLDDTIHSAEDMEKFFGLVPLTSIPENAEFRLSDKADDDDKHRRDSDE